MTDAFLAGRKISKRYGGVVALDNVDLTVAHAEIHCLVGQNGSGKSTFVKIITGVVPPDSGAEIEIEGERFAHLTPDDAFRKGIQVVHQDLSLFPNLTVAENVAVAYLLEHGRTFVKRRDIARIATAALARIGVDLPLDLPLSTLPLADRQLVAICRALASDARLIIMDEPTAALTRREVDRLMGVIRDLQAKGIATLFISHKLDEVLEIGQAVTILRDGRRVGSLRREEIDRRTLVRLMVGKELVYSKFELPARDREAVLEVRGLTKQGQFADISFTLYRGESLGIIGPRGSGRTEFALSLFGMNPPDAGAVAVEGRAVHLGSNADAIHVGIAYVPEDRLRQGIVLNQSVANNLVVTVMRRVQGALGLIDGRRKDGLAEEAVRSFGILAASVQVPARTLSGGNQQKVVIAKWLEVEPKILILDGPTVGIDIGAKENIYEIIRGLARAGMSILLISDEIPEVLSNCNRVLLMKYGRLLGEFDSNVVDEETLDRRMTE